MSVYYKKLIEKFWKAVRAGFGVAWQNERAVLFIIILFQLFLARRSFYQGIWADNDSVCHYAYLRHLLEDIYPATGTFFGYSPRFNMGVPFLLYNTPPGLYVLSAVISTLIHVSALAALKICVVAGFVSVPILGFSIAKTFKDAPEDTPKFVGIMLAVFSSELYGLEFFFRNGMLNPAIGVPLLLGTIYFFCRAQRLPFPSAIRYLVFAAALFACTVFTHLLTAYMLGIALVALVLGQRSSRWGKDVLSLAFVLALGTMLASFWLIPSMSFAAHEDAAYTWLRRPSDIVSSFVDGSLLSSYFAAFFPSFITISNVGLIANLLGLIAIVIGVRRRETGPTTFLIAFILAFIVTLGPSIPFAGRLIPGYDRLLWYRFLTLAEISWLVLAGFGAAYLLEVAKEAPFYKGILVFGISWCVVVISGRAVKVETSSEYPTFVSDVNQVAAWLREQGDSRARVFDEFLGQAVIQPPSPNYARHMMPILSGFSEIGGWVYENNLAGQILMKKGVFWHNPFPIIEQAPEYNVKYIVAGSPHLVRGLSMDPRWNAVLKTQSLILFENSTYEPFLVEGDQLVGNATSEHYTRGGGYEYNIQLSKAPPYIGKGPMVVKVGYIPGFSVFADDVPVKVHPSPDGMLELELPQGLQPRYLRCRWDITALRQRGNLVTFCGILIAVALILVSFVGVPSKSLSERLISWSGICLAIIGIAITLIRSRNVDLSPVGFGIRNGITATEDPYLLNVGGYDDDRANRLIHVLPAAWGERSTSARRTARTLMVSEHPAFQASLSDINANTLTLYTDEPPLPFTAILESPNERVRHCSVDGVTNQAILLPRGCTAGDTAGPLPGMTRNVWIKTKSPVKITAISVKNSIRLVEAESFKNVISDGGYEAFYQLGAIESPPSNGILMTASAQLNSDIDLFSRVQTPSGHVNVWLLTRTLHPRFQGTRANITVFLNGKSVGVTRGISETSREYWERDTTFEWIHIGEANLSERTDAIIRISKVKGAVAGLAEIDALAFVPM